MELEDYSGGLSWPSDETSSLKTSPEKLRRDLTAIFSQLPSIPDATVASINTAEHAEDEKTFIVWLTMEDGREVYMQFAPGDAISISVR